MIAPPPAGALAPCANDCGRRVSAAHFTKCAPCLLGQRKLDKYAAQLRAVEALPPFLTFDDPAAPTVFRFRVPGSPMSYNNALVRRRGGRPYLSDKAREWKRIVAICAVAAAALGRPGGLGAPWRLPAARVALELLCVFPSARSDADGPIKLVQDALQGICYANDRQVVSVHARKLVDPCAPRLEVTVRLVG